MSKKKKARIDTSGKADEAPVHNPFAALQGLVPDAPPETSSDLDSAPDRAPDRGDQKRPGPPTPSELPHGGGRIDIVRNTAGRGGKTVTVASGFDSLSKAELKSVLRAIQKTCGVGGTVRNDEIEIQGDQREALEALLKTLGFRPVRAGG